MMELQGLSGGYGSRQVISDVTLHVPDGSFFGLLGPNGSGKTTLFKLISGSLVPTAGSASLHGKPLSTMKPVERARHLAVLSQETSVSFDFTAEEIIQLGRYAFQTGLFKQLRAEDRQVMEDVMVLTRTTEFRNRPFYQLSGGEKQRVLLAKALVQEPEVLLLDEPTNHLDIRHTFDMLDMLKQWQKERKLTIIAILHDINTAALYCDRMALLSEGKIVEEGSVDLLRNPERLAEVYEVETWPQAHPVVPRPQLVMTPKNRGAERGPLLDSYSLEQSSGAIVLSFDRPLRSISNGVAGEGIQWMTHFANFHVDKQYQSRTPEEDVRRWIESRNLPAAQSIGMMTAVFLERAIVRETNVHGIPMLAVVTAGTGNAVDITSKEAAAPAAGAGTINMFLFADVHLSDGGLVNASMSAVEAKVKALADHGITDAASGTAATGTSTDSIVFAASQRGRRSAYAGSGTPLGRAIGQSVYEAVTAALQLEKEAGR
ncbi:adenosylcobinamide amidohydrolase [Alkalicoccus urumqiensis]|uniref:ABC transporter domain-containing protein n=1 Tax=Alkalicoccus urumqiensis TaxID=1548213 RepID=A0A2P6MI88_ALKUR|nr:adenosylcobinamide amidohydrolase [Alkalicoccus urumqiensis]PRO66002.1 hypothetical protein C6I21_06780 [Alkalicoccus urumqiensis]